MTEVSRVNTIRELVEHSRGDYHRGPTAASPIHLWTVVRCMIAIARTKRALRRGGLTKTLSALRNRYARASVATSVATPIDPLALAAQDRIVAIAAAFYPGRALCLERSLVLYARLCRLGSTPEFQLGVQAAPFGAHAWVTYDGVPVNDCAEHVSQFTVIPDAQP